MNITLLEPLAVNEQVYLDFQLQLQKQGHTFTYYLDKASTSEEMIERAKDSEILIVANTPLPSEVVLACPQLQMISVAFTGVDHIPLDTCKQQGIVVCNSAGYSNQSVAELVIAMSLIALRKIIDTQEATRNGFTAQGFESRELAGKTVGIIGMGKIGKRCAQLFQAFGANVIAYNHSVSEEVKDMGIQYTTLPDLLSSSDIVSLHLPLNAHTKNFMSAKKIAMMKPSTIFINCARGPIVDNEALAHALNNDALGYACIDVYDMEPPLPSEYPLLHAKNTLLTPHQAYISEEAMIRRADIVFSNVLKFIEGTPQNVCK